MCSSTSFCCFRAAYCGIYYLISSGTNTCDHKPMIRTIAQPQSISKGVKPLEHGFGVPGAHLCPCFSLTELSRRVAEVSGSSPPTRSHGHGINRRAAPNKLCGLASFPTSSSAAPPRAGRPIPSLLYSLPDRLLPRSRLRLCILFWLSRLLPRDASASAPRRAAQSAPPTTPPAPARWSSSPACRRSSPAAPPASVSSAASPSPGSRNVVRC